MAACTGIFEGGIGGFYAGPTTRAQEVSQLIEEAQKCGYEANKELFRYVFERVYPSFEVSKIETAIEVVEE